VPFKSTKQKTYLAINEPEVYKKFKKEEQNMYGKKMVKRPMGGKVYKNIVKKPMGGKVHKVDNREKDQEKKMQYMTKSQKRIEPKLKYLPGIGAKVSPPVGRLKKGSKTTKRSKRSMGGKVYKVDNSGQQMVAKQYGGKIHG